MATIIEMNTHGVQSNEFSQTLTKEQRLHAREQMARQFAELLGRSPMEKLYWQESVTDLIDLSHEVYMTELLKDDEGGPSPSAA